MDITKIPGRHSEKDEIIIISANKEALTLEQLFELIYLFSTNELNRIRIPYVRKQIINGEKPFFFEQQIINTIETAKAEALKGLI